MHRFAMKKSLYEKLVKLVKARDKSLAFVYQKYIGEMPPPYGGEVHHIVFRSAGGPDKEDNLILLSLGMHEYGIHVAMRRERKKNEGNFKAYLQSEEVKAWRERHWEELQTLYRKTEEDLIEEKRKKCLPKKRPGLPY